MHEQGGVFCKTGNSGLIGKLQAGKKTLYGPKLRSGPGHGGAAHIGPLRPLARFVEEAGWKGGAGPRGCWANAGEGRCGGPGTLAARSTRAGG